MVTVAVRSDGTIETVTLVVSSGVPDIDEAVRRIVQSHAPHLPFPPDLARDYDVAEIRRTWIFDVAAAAMTSGGFRLGTWASINARNTPIGAAIEPRLAQTPRQCWSLKMRITARACPVSRDRLTKSPGA